LVQCPYDPVHMIRPARLGHHLVKCRAALQRATTSPYYSRLESTVICEFNSNHHIPRKDYKEHLKTCAENLATQKAINTLHTENVKISGISDIMSGVDKVQGGNDDWDDWEEDNYAPYDPTSKMAETPMILPQGLTPAERRDFRIAKRQGEHHEKLGLDPKPAAPKQPTKVANAWSTGISVGQDDDDWNDDNFAPKQPTKVVNAWSTGNGISNIKSGVNKVSVGQGDDWNDNNFAPKVEEKPRISKIVPVEKAPPMIKAPEPTPEAKKVNKDGWIEQPKPVPKPKAPKAAQQPKQQPQKAVVNKFALLTVDDDGVPKKSKKGKKKK